MTSPHRAEVLARAPSRARWAVAAIFFLNGAVLASWLAHIPAVKAQHGLTDDRLGLVLLSMAAGSVLALPIAGWLLARWGSRVITSAAAIGFCLALPLPVIAPSAMLVTLGLALLGAWNAVLDVSMNAQAILVEEGYQRPIMSGFHGLFSAGGLVGAAVASAAMALDVSAEWHVVGVALISSCVLAAVLGSLLPPTGPSSASGQIFARPPAALMALGLLTFCGLLAEGAMGDWSAVYLHDSLGANPAVAATGFAAFSLAMAVGRFGGDRIADRLGPILLLRISAAIAAAGLAGALLLARTSAAVVGCGLVGLGIANVIPVLFSAAGRVPAMSAGTALAGIATTGYAGYLAGPPLIGLTASVTGLPVALGIVAAACALIAAGASAVPTGRTVQ
jgi:MFS family permease